MNPITTYRFQFHKEFSFADFERVIPYLKKLGVATIYASPVFQSTPGSTHGYDGLNPHCINPEIGSEEQLRTISRQLKAEGMQWLQDIVPNHMAYHTANKWLMDVLEKGPQSIYASFFDIAWSSPLFQGRLMVPFLGGTLEEVLDKGEVKIDWKNDRLVFNYYENHYPLQPKSYVSVLQGTVHEAPDSIKQLLEQLPKSEDAEMYAQQWDEWRAQLTSLMKNEAVQSYCTGMIDQANNQKELLQKIAGEQSYRLCHWQETDHHINYRRFFTVNGLICLNIQNEKVFETYHLLIRKWLEEGIFQGLRVDHIDGLYDPTEYLKRLQQLAGEESYIVVEKILEPGEVLPDYWPVQGNTGYDFLSLVNNLLTYKKSEPLFTRFYRQLVKDQTSVHQQLHDKKAYILYEHMAGELENLYRLFLESNIIEKRLFSSVRQDELKEAIAEFLIQCPVYRYYGNHFPLQGDEYNAIQYILNRIRNTNSGLNRAVNVLEQALLKKPQEGNAERNMRAAHFYKRCMQFTGPLMAKGVEDTLMYTYNRFIGHNEVGDSPDAFGMSIDDFHNAMKERQQKWPLSLNATSTHDTKRGEDMRARLNVLTDLGDEWLNQVTEWLQANEGLKQDGTPDANDEYFIYQTLAGVWPMAFSEEDNLESRMQEYLQKALREAKAHSNWTSPNEQYESATKSFALKLIQDKENFHRQFESLHYKIKDHGIINSLTQLILKFTCPGVPDTYQGCELWDFSLVDPDNRRQVDYDKRNRLLEEMEGREGEEWLRELWQDRTSGRIKLWFTRQLMKVRSTQPDVFASGEYMPVHTGGKYKEHIIAFARIYQQSVYVVVLPLHTAILCKEQNRELTDLDWADTHIVLPREMAHSWEHVLLSVKDTHKKEIPVQHLFKPVPFSILKGQQEIKERGAGILLHITSLPSPFGIGDLGPEARAFAQFLQRSRQKFWQLLPLNPTEAGQGHSPYSSISSRAGNVLLISPELLAKEKLLSQEDMSGHLLAQEGKTNYAEAERVKKELFDIAWNNYKEGHAAFLKEEFDTFKQKEAEWLQDFALYMVLKHKNSGKPWYQWEEKYKQHDQGALQQLMQEEFDHAEKIMWLQFIFAYQWKKLKTYCNSLGIRLIGDLPFYISYDSSDVWSHRNIFAVDEQGNTTGMAGVPPDDFSADGQLWGMPVFKWDVLKEQEYKWWIERFKKNRELFDIVRLDHFRAFASYWEVPAGEKTAKNGQWRQGPGSDFFKIVEKELGGLPFIAEDLGDIDEPVYELRDEFHLPGMKVLQFAFGNDLAESVHIPHNHTTNFIVYTGTHDNNTVKGWFREEGKNSHQRIQEYLDRQVSENDIAFILSRMAYGSVARTAILPLQDVLALDQSARMNRPASGSDNWDWRLIPGQINADAEGRLRWWVEMYNR